MSLEPWELSDEQIWAEVDYALVAKWMLSSERSEESKRKRASLDARLSRDPATQRHVAESLWRAAQAWAEMWAKVALTWEVRPYDFIGSGVGDSAPAAFTGTRSIGRQTPVRQHGPRTAPDLQAALLARPAFRTSALPAQRQHRRQHR